MLTQRCRSLCPGNSPVVAELPLPKKFDRLNKPFDRQAAVCDSQFRRAVCRFTQPIQQS